VKAAIYKNLQLFTTAVTMIKRYPISVKLYP